MAKKSNCWSLVRSFHLFYILCSANPVWAYTDEAYVLPKDQVTCEYDNAVSASAVLTSTCEEHESFFDHNQCSTRRWYIWCKGVRQGKLISATGCPKGYRTTRPKNANPCEHRIDTNPIIFDDFPTKAECEAERGRYDCKTRLIFEPDGDGTITHVVQTQFDCIQEEIPTPVGKAQATAPPASNATAVPRPSP